jgi:hypothetical protein
LHFKSREYVVHSKSDRLLHIEVFGILLTAVATGLFAMGLGISLAVDHPPVIPVRAVVGPIPMDEANPLWDATPGVVVPLSGQTIIEPMHTNISIKAIIVKVMTNGKEIGFHLNWLDKTKNDTTTGPRDFRDQAAIQFPVTDTTAARKPPLASSFRCMGQAGQLVNIWRWNAEWQKDLGRESAGLWDVDNPQAGIFWDYYFEEPAGGATYEDRIGRSLGPFNPGIWSGNIMSDPTIRIGSVEDLTASGFTALDTQAHQDVLGNGVWKTAGSQNDYMWSIVVKRSLLTVDANDVQFRLGTKIPVAFAIWDGANSERAGMKGVSTWFELELPSEQDLEIKKTTVAQTGSPTPFYNAWYTEDGPAQSDPSLLEIGKEYSLNFNIGRPLTRNHSLIREPSQSLIDHLGRESLDLRISVTCMFCRQQVQVKPLRLPKIGDSEVIEFNIKPIVKTNNASVRVGVEYNNYLHDEIVIPTNVLTSQEIARLPEDKKFNIAKHTTARALTYDVVSSTPHRDLRIDLIPPGYSHTDKYSIRLSSDSDWTEIRPTELSKTQLETDIRRYKARILDVLNGENIDEDDFNQVFITDETALSILKIFADTGSNIYERLFSDSLVKAALSNAGVINHISIVSGDDFYIPWNILYDKPYDSRSNQIEKSAFWGYKYVFDIRPGRTISESRPITTPVSDYSHTGLDFVFGSYNEEINAKNQRDEQYIFLRGKQRKFLESLLAISKVSEPIDEKTFLSHLEAQQTHPDIIYFFTHARGESLKLRNPKADNNDPTSYIVEGQEPKIFLQPPRQGVPPITPTDIERLSRRKTFVSNPLVFINACESGELTTLTVDSFVSHFFVLGAKGILVTDAVVWQAFAEAFGRIFIERYSKGEPVGKILLEIRREYLDNNSNPFGFLYTYYGNAYKKLEPRTNIPSKG